MCNHTLEPRTRTSSIRFHVQQPYEKLQDFVNFVLLSAGNVLEENGESLWLAKVERLVEQVDDPETEKGPLETV